MKWSVADFTTKYCVRQTLRLAMLCRLRLLIGLLRVFFVRSSVKSKIQRGLMNICPKMELVPKWQPLKIHDLPQSRRRDGEVRQCFSFERGRCLREKPYPSVIP